MHQSTTLNWTVHLQIQATGVSFIHLAELQKNLLPAQLFKAYAILMTTHDIKVSLQPL